MPVTERCGVPSRHARRGYHGDGSLPARPALVRRRYRLLPCSHQLPQARVRVHRPWREALLSRMQVRRSITQYQIKVHCLNTMLRTYLARVILIPNITVSLHIFRYDNK